MQDSLQDRSRKALPALNHQATLLELYANERDGLFNYLCGMLKDPFIAEDIMQDVFTALLKRDIQRPDFNLKAYVFSSARNKVIDYFRRNKVWKGAFSSLVALQSAAEKKVANALVESEIHDGLRDELEKLSAEQQEIIYLHLHGEMTFAEIAQTLGLPQGTVSSRYLRGINKLKESLEGSDYDPGK